MHGLSLIESFAVFQTHSKKPRAQRTQGLNNGALIERATKNPAGWLGSLRYKCLTMTYSRMGRPHTTIGAKRFHF